MTIILGLSELRSYKFIYFSFQCQLELEDWCTGMVKRKILWDRSKIFSVSENLLCALIPDLQNLHHRQPRKMAEESLDKVTFVTHVPLWLWKRQPTWYWLLLSWSWSIPVDTELKLNCCFNCLGWRTGGCGFWHLHWNTIIVRGNPKLSWKNATWSLALLLGSRSWSKMTNLLCLNSTEDLCTWFYIV